MYHELFVSFALVVLKCLVRKTNEFLRSIQLVKMDPIGFGIGCPFNYISGANRNPQKTRSKMRCANDLVNGDRKLVGTTRSQVAASGFQPRGGALPGPNAASTFHFLLVPRRRTSRVVLISNSHRP
jgi:hypothetical protein